MIFTDDYIVVNGVSSDDVDIHIDTPPAPPMPQQRYTTAHTGADEDQTVPDDTYEDMEYSLDFYKFLPESYDNTAIYAYFANAQTLQISKLPGFYFKVRRVSVVSRRVVADGKRIDYTVTFTLAPFKYKSSNDWVSVSSGDTVKNEGTRYARPLYKIHTQSQHLVYKNDVTLTVNGVDFELKDLPSSADVYVDCERYIVYSGDTIMTYKSYGQFPFLAVGDNTIEISGRYTTLAIKKNERCY